MSPHEDAVRLLAAAAYVSLRSYRRDDSAVDVPVWVAGLDGALVVFTDGTSWKVKRLRRSPRCAVAVCDVRGRLSGPWHEATAAIVFDADRERRAYEALRAKYGWRMRALDLLSTVAGRIGRRVVLALDLAAP